MDDAKKLYRPAQLRTTDSIQIAYNEAVMRLSRSQRARFFGGPCHGEATTTALWLWFSRLPREEAEQFLADLLPEVEEALRRDAASLPAGEYLRLTRKHDRRLPPKLGKQLVVRVEDGDPSSGRT